MRKVTVSVISAGDRGMNTYAPYANYGHSGGDEGIVRDFVRLVRADGQRQGLTSSSTSVQSHFMAFAAEEARIHKKVIELNEYARELKAGLSGGCSE